MLRKSFLDATLRTAKGSATREMKEGLADFYLQLPDMNYFIADILGKVEAVQIDFQDSPEEPRKKQAKMIFETVVTLDMCNAYRSLHGGCSASLIDLCTSMTLTFLALQIMPHNSGNLSLALNTMYHAPAPLGSRIRIINTTTSMGNRTMTARAEMYDVTNGRLVASGSQIKMCPAPAKL